MPVKSASKVALELQENKACCIHLRFAKLHLAKSVNMPGNCDITLCIQQPEKRHCLLEARSHQKHSRRHSSTHGGDSSPNCVIDHVCRVFGVHQHRDHA